MTLKPSTLGVTTQNWIGRSQYTNDPYLDGRVDDFRIYNSAMTASQVMHLVNGQTVFPVAELPFNETTGTTASDVSGNGWNGTLTGGASLVAGNKGNAVDLNGTNGYVTLPSGVVSGNNAVTISAWVYLDTSQQMGADLRLRFRYDPLHVPDAAKRFKRLHPFWDQKRRDGAKDRRDCGAAYRWLASCSRILERFYWNTLCRWPASRQRQHQHQTVTTRHYHAESDRPIAIQRSLSRRSG